MSGRKTTSSNDHDDSSRNKSATDEKPKEELAKPVRYVPFPARVLRALKDREVPPDRRLIDEEPTPESEARKQQEEVQGDMEERIRTLIEAELHALTFSDKRFVATYRVDVCKDERADVARMLYWPPETSALRVAMWRALDEAPCGQCGRCEGVPECAHSRGKALWDALIERVIAKLQKVNEVHHG